MGWSTFDNRLRDQNIAFSGVSRYKRRSYLIYILALIILGHLKMCLERVRCVFWMYFEKMLLVSNTEMA